MIATILCAGQRCHPATVVSAAANRRTAALRYDWNAQMSASFLFPYRFLEFASGILSSTLRKLVDGSVPLGRPCRQEAGSD